MAILFISAGIYIFVIGTFYYGWLRLKPFKPGEPVSGKFVTVLVPVCNEQANIAGLIHDFTCQSYPVDRFEIIVIDDHSTDDGPQMIADAGVVNLKLVALPPGKHGKKQALAMGLGHAGGDIIVTTDADCRRGPEWLKIVVAGFQQYNPGLLLLPVLGIDNHSVFGRWQQLELFSLLGSTAGSAAVKQPVMCNGANLAYPKSVAHLVRKVYDDTTTVSGDDIFTLIEIKKKSRAGIFYLKTLEGAVYTTIASSRKEFYKQRRRWVSKARYYTDWGIILSALTVLQLNLLLMIFFVSGLLNGNFNHFFLLLLLKSAIDFPFLMSVTSFFREKKLMLWFPVVQGFYFFYVCITVLRGFSVKPRWKNNLPAYVPAD